MNPTSRYFFSVVAALSAVPILVWHPFSAYGQDLTMAVIERAWRDRQAEVSSFDITWTEHRIRTSAFWPAGLRDRFPKGDTEHKFERRLAIEGEKLRYFTNEPTWLLSEGVWYSQDKIVVTDGVTAKGLQSVKARAFPDQGSTFGAKALREDIANRSDLAPILLHFQPFAWRPNALDGFTVTPGRHDLDATACVIVRRVEQPREPQAPLVIESMWLDPGEQFSLRRDAFETGGKIFRQLDMQYRREGTGLIPTAWRATSYLSSTGQMMSSVEATVSSGKVNGDIPDDEFDIAFPAGTRVLEPNQRGTDNQVLQYVARPNGTLRYVPAPEMARARSPQDLLESPVGRAGLPASKTLAWPWWLVGLLAAGLIAFVVFRSFREA